MTRPVLLRVFVVEDNAETLKWLQLDLEAAGYEVCTARSVREALEGFSLSKSHVLLSDIGLPDGTGWDILSHLRDCPPSLSIAMSGYGTKEDAQRSRTAGFAHHLVKPFEPEQLYSILRLAEEAIQPL